MPVLMILPSLALVMDPSMVPTCAALLKKVNLLTACLMLMSADVLMQMMLELPVLETVKNYIITIKNADGFGPGEVNNRDVVSISSVLTIQRCPDFRRFRYFPPLPKADK